ncbi:PQQ-binding-like beta-propeller repeat protein [Streptomyces sp. NPDC059063]|uniref:serine/threonine-protein kinase n=1 Tax=unclassified Streptomyces TaxID=2593676 RepID=UPI003681D901
MALRETDPGDIGGYPIEDRLGSGGMGVVYLARSPSGRRLAVKVVHGQYADDEEFRIRFRREVEAARQVSGAFTAPVVDADAGAPRPWMATLYIPGETLGAYVRREGPLPLPRLRELAAGLTEALRDIHRVGVVHRDLKPANVMLAEDGPRVIDFGVSRAAEALAGDPLTQTGRVMGTPPYMSPEQLTSPREVGPASDVFSLGAILTYAATGRGPFDDASPYETATRVVEGTPELSGVPPELRPFVEQCLTKHPKSRPTPDELLALLGGEPLSPARPQDCESPPPTAPSPARPRPRRFVIAGAAGALLAGVAAGLVLWLTGEGPGNLPDGWRAWQARTPSDPEREDGAFSGCVAVRGGLVCAGDDVKAARFSLATGEVAWSQRVNQGPADWANAEGHVLGATDDRVFVYRNTQSQRKGSPPVEDYAIQALEARTGAVIWTAPTQRGAEASAPAPDAYKGGAVQVDDGILTAFGPKGDKYTLLDADRGNSLWVRRLPSADCRIRGDKGQGYLVCPARDTDRVYATRVIGIDPSGGEPSWEVTVGGKLTFVGQAGGRLVFTTEADTAKNHRITTIEVGTWKARQRPLARPQPTEATLTIGRDTLYFTYPNGDITAVDPVTGRGKWLRNSTVERPGPPLVTGSRIYLASPSGRIAALDRKTGKEVWARPARSSSAGRTSEADSGAPLTLVGDALYVPYGIRSVYSIDVRNP